MRFLFVDRIIELTPGESVRGVKHITLDDPFLTSDGQGHLHFTSSLIGETLGQLAAWNVMHYNDFQQRPVAGVVASATMHRPAYVGETLLLESFIESLDERAVQYHSEARVGDELVFTVEGALGPLVPMADFIDDKVIRQQFAEVYRPGDWATLKDISQPSVDKYSLSHARYLAPALAFDASTFQTAEQTMLAYKKLSRAAPYFPDHFPNKPVLPMTVLLECKLRLAQEFLKHLNLNTTFHIREFRKIKMNEFVQPGDVLCCHVKIKEQNERELILHCRSEVEGRRVCVADVVLVSKE